MRREKNLLNSRQVSAVNFYLKVKYNQSSFYAELRRVIVRESYYFD